MVSIIKICVKYKNFSLHYLRHKLTSLWNPTAVLLRKFQSKTITFFTLVNLSLTLYLPEKAGPIYGLKLLL